MPTALGSRRFMCLVDKSHISRNVLAYLSARPEARDTLEGIVEWWLVEQRIVEQTAVVREALAELVAGGLLLERRGADSRTLYCVSRRAAGADEPPPDG